VSMLQVFKLLTWLGEKDYESLYNEAEEITKMLSGLIKSIR